MGSEMCIRDRLNTTDQIKLKTSKICNLTVFGSALKSFLLSSNSMFAESIMNLLRDILLFKYFKRKNQLKNFPTKYNPKATAGPMPKAKSNVPIPTVPPKYHPIDTTEISKNALTDAIGKFVFLCKPVIRPSLGPGPKLAIK